MKGVEAINIVDTRDAFSHFIVVKAGEIKFNNSIVLP